MLNLPEGSFEGGALGVAVGFLLGAGDSLLWLASVESEGEGLGPAGPVLGVTPC